MKERIRRIFSNIKEKPDAIIIKNSSEPFIDHNFFYITGLQKGLFEGSMAIIFPDGTANLIVSQLEKESAKKADANVLVYKKSDEYNELLKKSLKHVHNVGLNFEGIPHKSFCRLKDAFPEVDFLDVSGVLTKTRTIKDDIEIDLIRKAAEIVDKVMKEIPNVVHDNMFEYELAAEINYLMQKNGASHPAFDTISSFGKNTAEPHYSHGNTRLKNGDFVLCDFGACFKKYNSDITRTFVFEKVDEKQKKMYETVLEAQRIGLEKIKSGVKSCEIHNAVASYIDNSDFKGCFIHSTGHSLGLEVHDGGVGFTESCEVELVENMVLTVEPGVYIPGFGGVRIEDDIVVKNDGCESLTKSSKELIEI